MDHSAHDQHHQSMMMTTPDDDLAASSSQQFCHGGGMIMYMDGFHISLRSGHPCLNLLFHWLTLNTRWKFVLCTIVVFGLAVAVEGLAFFRHVTVAKSKQQARQQQQQVLARYSIPVLHGLQAAAGYTLMLIAMTFSLELMCSVVMGLATGYAIFFVVFEGDDDPYQLRQHVTTNPCCEFMEEESRETTTITSNNNQNARGGANNVGDGEDDLTLILAEGAADAGAPTNNTSTTIS